MALDSFLLEVLEDPTDHGTLLYIESASVLYNPRKKIAYEVRGAITVLLPDESRPATDAEHNAWTSDATGVTTGR